MTTLVKKCKTLKDYIKAEEKLSNDLKTTEFEDYVGLWLKCNPIYSPHTAIFSPNNNYEVPLQYLKKYKLHGIADKGQKSEGFDWYKLTDDSAIGFECKYQHNNKSIKGSKLAIKEVAANKSLIKNRILVTNQSTVSAFVREKLDNWGVIYGDEVYTEESFQRIKYFLKYKKPQDFLPVDYRVDEKFEIGSQEFHKKNIKEIWDCCLKQLRSKHGHAMVLSEKPTGSGKGFDPILLENDYIKPYFTGENILTCTVNPQLTVLTGNIKKRLSDSIARNSNTKYIVVASDPINSIDDAEQLQLARSMVTVVSSDKLIDEILDWQEGNYDLHIETTIHSYKHIGAIIDSENIEGHFMYIDEVKVTVLEDSTFTQCIDNNYGKWKIRVGADANFIEAKNDKGEHMWFSMGNTKLWRDRVIWEEEDVVKRGWKRKTVPEVYLYDIAQISDPNLKEMLGEGKLFDFNYNGTAIPKMWAISVHMIVNYFFTHPSRQYYFNQLNSKENVAKFVKFAEKFSKEVALQKGDLRNPTVKKIYNMKWVDIYANGNTHNKILRTLDGVPVNYPNQLVVVNQVKKASMGWDPDNGWVDTISFTDQTNSKVRASQTIGRGQRNGRGLDDVRVAIPLVYDSSDEYSVKNDGMKVLQQVTNTLFDGKNIQDDIIFYDFSNSSTPSTGTRGKKHKRSVFNLDATTFAGAYKFFTKNNLWSPYSSIVEAIYYDLQSHWDNAKYGTINSPRELNDSIMKKEEYKEFLVKYDSKNNHLMLSSIRMGNFHLLPIELKIDAKKKYKEFKKNEKLYYKSVTDTIKYFCDNFDESTINVYDFAGRVWGSAKDRQYNITTNKCTNALIHNCLNENYNFTRQKTGEILAIVGRMKIPGNWGDIDLEKINKSINNFQSRCETYVASQLDKICEEYVQLSSKYLPGKGCFDNTKISYKSSIIDSLVKKHKVKKHVIHQISRHNTVIKRLEKIQKSNFKKIKELYNIHYKDNIMLSKNANQVDEVMVGIAKKENIIADKRQINKIRIKHLSHITKDLYKQSVINKTCFQVVAMGVTYDNVNKLCAETEMTHYRIRKLFKEQPEDYYRISSK